MREAGGVTGEPEVDGPSAEVVAAGTRRRPAPADVACAGALAASTAAGYVLAGLTPALLRHHVLLLEALTGSTVAIVTAGALSRTGRLLLPLAVLAPLAAIAFYDVVLWWAGRRWGTALVTQYTRRRPRAARRLDRAETLVRERGVLALAVAYYLPVPNALVYLFAGTSGMRLRTFLVGDALGVLLWETLLLGLGWGLGRRAVDVVSAVDRHATGVTLVVLGLWIGWRLLARRQGR